MSERLPEQPAPAPSMIGKVVVITVRGRNVTDQATQYVGRLASYSFTPFLSLSFAFEGLAVATLLRLSEGKDISIQAFDPLKKE